MVDKLDIEIIKVLAKNSRLSIREIASTLKQAHSSVHQRMRKLLERGVIKRFTILVDYESLGFSITALILLQVEGAYIVEVGEILSKEPNVISVYDITGDYDLAIIAKLKDIHELDRFVKKINKNKWVKRTVTSIVLRSLKEDPLSLLSLV